MKKIAYDIIVFLGHSRTFLKGIYKSKFFIRASLK